MLRGATHNVNPYSQNPETPPPGGTSGGVFRGEAAMRGASVGFRRVLVDRSSVDPSEADRGVAGDRSVR
jgi:hypothetical protein